MSKETLQHLNTNTLIGFTDNRGHAWHYRAEEQGDEPNHYPGAIPIVDVQRRLFAWTAESRRVAVELPADVESMTHLDDQGQPMSWAVVEDRQGICRSDTGSAMGIFSAGYTPHQYGEWLLTTVANLLDDDLSISSAGLLRGGAVAWVEVSVPETITTPEGVAFRPNLLATKSIGGCPPAQDETAEAEWEMSQPTPPKCRRTKSDDADGVPLDQVRQGPAVRERRRAAGRLAGPDHRADHPGAPGPGLGLPGRAGRLLRPFGVRLTAS